MKNPEPISHVVFKGDAIQRVAVEIVEHAISHPAFWTDALILKSVSGAPPGSIRECCRVLLHLGIISKTGRHRYGHSNELITGKVWEFEIYSYAKAHAFIARHRAIEKTINTQPDLLAFSSPYPSN